jgi:2-aminoethylphosphonate-pyruvate transaminase
MYPFTARLPKGFLSIDGIPLIKRSINNLLKAGIEKIIIGTGHKSKYYEALADDYPVICKYNPDYAQTGSMYTLYNARELIQSDFLLIESDILYDGHGLQVLIKGPQPNVVLASGLTGAGDEVFIEVDQQHNLLAMSKNKESLGSIYGELTGISKISFGTYQVMNHYAENNFDQNPGLDYEHALVGVGRSETIYVHKINGYAWCEIDDQQHLDRARSIVYPLIKKSEKRSTG